MKHDHGELSQIVNCCLKSVVKFEKTYLAIQPSLLKKIQGGTIAPALSQFSDVPNLFSSAAMPRGALLTERAATSLCEPS